jgi:hypothetical protein
MRLPSGERFEWVKPIMLSGGRQKYGKMVKTIGQLENVE